ncbi:hypothetical protein [Azotobacter salinestris]|uniref:hypothetical protein n=1 Tax=Azotobacter salinestris TaxID=69964 RepID=UPI0032E02299
MPAAHEAQNNAMVLIGTQADKPLMTVTPLHGVPAGARPVDVATTGIDRLSPLLQVIPSVAVAGGVTQSRLMQVVIDGPLAKVANGEGFRAFTLEGGRIREHARLFEPLRLQQLVNAAALFQIASVVVAQKHLADISAKLSEIKAGVDAIAQFLEAQRKSEITGALKYLRQLAAMLQDGEQDDAARTQLEGIELKLGCIHDHLNDELANLTAHVIKLEAPGLFGTSADLTVKLKAAQEKVDRKVEAWKLCMSGRWVACSLLAQLVGRTSLVTRREQALRDEAKAFLAADGPLEKFRTAVAERIQTLNSLRDSRSMLQVNRIALRKWEENKLPVLQSDTRRDISQAQKLLLEREKKVTLTIELRDGQCVAAYQL